METNVERKVVCVTLEDHEYIWELYKKITESYNRHKPIIDALAKDDEMFRAVKEIAETKDQSAISK